MRNLNFQEYSHIIKALLIFIWIPALHYGQTADVVQGPSGIPMASSWVTLPASL